MLQYPLAANHAKPIKDKGVKPIDIDKDAWAELNELIHLTIELSVSDAFLFKIEYLDSPCAIWTRLQELYA